MGVVWLAACSGVPDSACHTYDVTICTKIYTCSPALAGGGTIATCTSALDKADSTPNASEALLSQGEKEELCEWTKEALDKMSCTDFNTWYKKLIGGG